MGREQRARGVPSHSIDPPLASPTARRLMQQLVSLPHNALRQQQQTSRWLRARKGGNSCGVGVGGDGGRGGGGGAGGQSAQVTNGKVTMRSWSPFLSTVIKKNQWQEDRQLCSRKWCLFLLPLDVLLDPRVCSGAL